MIEAMTGVTWESLRRLKVSEWLWLDMVGQGLHRADALPEAQPAQLSHLWGWGSEMLFRIRADRSLPGGFVGASVAREGLGPGAEAILWPEGIGRVGDQTAALRRSLRLTAHEVRVDEASVTMHITFYEGRDE